MKKLIDFNNQWVVFKGVWFDPKSSATRCLVSLDGKVFGFTEDEDDGYRSSAIEEGIVKAPKGTKFSLSFNPIPLFAQVSDNGDFSGITLYQDETCKVALAAFGTNQYDDYYPCYTAWVDVERINLIFFGKKNLLTRNDKVLYLIYGPRKGLPKSIFNHTHPALLGVRM